MAPAVRAIITALEHMQVVAYFDVASAAVLLYDYILTFGLEVSLIWFSPWNITKVLYLVTRYLPFVDITIVLYHQLMPGMSIHQCELAYKSSGWMFVIGMAMAEVILSLRTWAVWGRDTRLSAGLPIFFLLVWTPVFVIMGIFLKSMQFGHLPLPNFRGCIVTAGNPILFVCWVLLMIYEAGILALMLIRGIATYRCGGDSALFNVVYRDGILYYLYLFTLSVINVVVIPTLPHDFVNLLSSLERVIHAMLTSRVILHMREKTNRSLAYADGATLMGNSMSLQPMAFRAPAGSGFTSEDRNWEAGATKRHARSMDSEVGETL